MSFEAVVSRFRSKSRQVAHALLGDRSNALRRRSLAGNFRRMLTHRWIPKLRPRGLTSRSVYPAQDQMLQVPKDDNSVSETPQKATNVEPEIRAPTPNTFFDVEFLKKLERLRLVAKRLSWASAKGDHPASRKGFSLEFADYRRYQRGDDLRYVDWNIYRRLDRLLLKVFSAEEEMNVYLLVDTSRSMAEGMPAKIDYAKKVAAALGYIGLQNLDRVGGASFSSVLQSPLRLGRGRKQVLSLFNFLSKLSCGGETDLRSAVHSFTSLFPHPGLTVVVSDLFDPVGWRVAFEELTKKKYQLLVIHVLDEQELSPTARGDAALLDVEGGGERKCFLDAELVRRFQRELENYFREIETLCTGLGIDYLRTTTQVPFDEFVLKTLRQVSSVT